MSRWFGQTYFSIREWLQIKLPFENQECKRHVFPSVGVGKRGLVWQSCLFRVNQIDRWRWGCIYHLHFLPSKNIPNTPPHQPNSCPPSYGNTFVSFVVSPDDTGARLSRFAHFRKHPRHHVRLTHQRLRSTSPSKIFLLASFNLNNRKEKILYKYCGQCVQGCTACGWHW